jgi:PTH2 family peptidyl-tRNA hydrolase
MSNIKQVIVMRTDLNMRKGKMVAQGAHASMAFLLNNTTYSSKKDIVNWINHGQAKICVGVTTLEEFEVIEFRARNAGLEVHMITDSGRTEFNGVPTVTCLAIGPNKAEDIDKITGHLKLL